ncbi:hypothetical protein MAR_007134 [Mya arenaria]|uniref:Uncharacterized protein n=1 Tax=Mya arenaria TaxID=6604 RepID=A0ABY7DF06_MYAAR|nr:hypothetical protein MAR_007134 [Mya arenaria]
MRRKSRSVSDNTEVVKMGMGYFITEDIPYPEKKDGRLYKFVKKHILQRKGSSNDVKEIHIVPDGDEFKWARRSGGSAASRSSTGTSGSEGDRLEVVHDMAEEYTQEAV